MSSRREFLAFVVIGSFAAGVNFVARIVIDTWTSFEIAVVLAYLLAMTTAFVLNRAYVFKASDGPWRRQYGRFAIVNVIALVQVFLISVGLERFLFPALGFTWHADEIAHAIGLASPILTSYWAHKKYSFAAVAS